MVVEPKSFFWAVGRLVERRDGQTWFDELKQFPHLTDLISDSGSGLCKGMKLLSGQRSEVRHTFDVFHLKHEGHKALRREYGAANRALEDAAAVQEKVAKLQRCGRSAKAQGGLAGRKWAKAEGLLDRAAASERAWQQVCRALEFFTPEGRLNSRQQAQAKMAEAQPDLQGERWAKVRRLLKRRQTLTFLDRLQERVNALGFSTDTRIALERLEAARRQPSRLQGEDRPAAAARGLVLVASVQLSKSDPDWSQKMAQFRQVLQDTWRASSLVEGINSVVRMHQHRHRRMTPSLLDLKRLHWNMHTFRSGRRKGRSPAELLGVALPNISWWDLLKLTPEELRQKLSAQGDGP
jgi:hypothetical protein